MKKRYLTILMCLILLIGLVSCKKKDLPIAEPTSAPAAPTDAPTAAPTAEPTADPAPAKTLAGFSMKDQRTFGLLGADVTLYEHNSTGAKVLFLENEDTERAFDITFKTPTLDNTGLPHVFEHAVTDGSKKYPSSSLFFNLGARTYNTFMNAMTYHFMTTYPIASLSEAQLLKYAEYYTDSCFNPMIYDDEGIFREEAWRYVMASEEDDLTLAGTVYSEMLGATTISRAASNNFYRLLFPGSIRGNDSGGEPDFIPDLTWQALKDYHNDYYHPSNALVTIYGRIEDKQAFLDLLDGYFSEYERADIGYEDKGYTPITGPVSETYTFGLESSASAEKNSYIYYGFACGDLSKDEVNQLDLYTTLLGDDSSIFSQKMNKELPYAGHSVYFDLEGPETPIVFSASNINEEDADTFKRIVEESIAYTAENGFDPDAVDSIKSAYKLSTLLATDGSNVGVNISQNIAYYWASRDDLYGYMDFIDVLDRFDEYQNDGTFKRITEKYLLNNNRTATALTIPVPGLKEEKDAALAEKLAGIKAGMSDSEKQKIIELTTAEKTEEDASEYVKQLQAVTADSLPEEARIYDYTDITENGTRYVDVTAEISDVLRTTLLLDAAGLTDEDLLYFKLYTDLLSELDTEKHARAELPSLINRYFFNGSIEAAPIDDDSVERGYHPYLEVQFTSLADDVASGYDLLYELLYETVFDDTEALAAEIDSTKTALKNNIQSSPYAEQLYRASAYYNEKYAYYEHINMLDYYTFLDGLGQQMQDSPESVIAGLKKIQTYLHNRENAVAGCAGDKKSQEANRQAVDAFLSRLDSIPVTEQTYSFPNIADSEAIILESQVQYNSIFASYEDLGLEDYTADLDVLASLVKDLYLYPQLREQYGIYDLLAGGYDAGFWICTYRDPYIDETFEVYSKLPEWVETNSTVTQDQLNDYILSNFSYYAAPKGELSGADSAVSTIISGERQEKVLDHMKELKSLTPERFKELVNIFAKLMDNGLISTTGSASMINSHRDFYEAVYNPFGAVEVTFGDMIDVNESDWYYKSVNFCLEGGLMEPVSESRFGAADDAVLGELALPIFKFAGGSGSEDDAISFFAGYNMLPSAPSDSKMTRAELNEHFRNICAGFGANPDDYDITGSIPADDQTASRADIAYVLNILFGE